MTEEKRGNVWVFIEQDAGKIADVSLELVCKGCELAAELGVKTEAVLPGSGRSDLTSVLHEYGCDNVFVLDDPALEPFRVLPYTKLIVDLVRKQKPNILMFGATPLGRSLAPRIASTLTAGLTADCTDLQIDDYEDRVNKRTLRQKLMQIRPAFGGNIVATIVNSWHDPQMVTVREGVMKLEEPVPGRRGEVTPVPVELDDDELLVKIIERSKEDKETDIKSSQIIVAGGYGVGSSDNFEIIHEFADAIGAGVGASRAAVDAGWVDHDHQVGQTGVTVRPRLYIACGISGSVQHRAGMDQSAKIVAINKDPEAPIFSVVDYGIVGDLNDVIPKFIKAYRARV